MSYVTIGFEVLHAHIRIIPRFEDDGHGGWIDWKNFKDIPPEEMQALARKLLATRYKYSIFQDGDMLILLGFIAGTLTTAALVPQLVHTWRTKETKDLSLGFLVVLLGGISLWFVYGVVLRDLPIMLFNAISACIVATLVALKVRHG